MVFYVTICILEMQMSYKTLILSREMYICIEIYEKFHKLFLQNTAQLATQGFFCLFVCFQM